MDIFERSVESKPSQIADLEEQLEAVKSKCQAEISDLEAKIAKLRGNVGIAGGRRSRRAKKTRKTKNRRSK